MIKTKNRKVKVKMTKGEMNGYFNFMEETLVRRISENVMQPPHSEILMKLTSYLLNANRIFGTGAGRSQLVVREFLMRLMHLGFVCYVEGETTTPAIKPGDCLVAVTGSGKTPATRNKIEAAKKIGATVIVFTSFPDSPSAKAADLVVEIKGRRIDDEAVAENKVENEKETLLDYSIRQLTGTNFGIIAPMGTLFEDSSVIFFDALVSLLMILTGQSESDLRERHENLS